MYQNDEKQSLNQDVNQEEKVRAMFEVEELEDRLEMATWLEDSDGADNPPAE